MSTNTYGGGSFELSGRSPSGSLSRYRSAAIYVSSFACALTDGVRARRLRKARRLGDRHDLGEPRVFFWARSMPEPPRLGSITGTFQAGGPPDVPDERHQPLLDAIHHLARLCLRTNAAASIHRDSIDPPDLFEEVIDMAPQR